jgi:hypothetical protein
LVARQPQADRPVADGPTGTIRRCPATQPGNRAHPAATRAAGR